MRRLEHLPARSEKKRVQGVRWGEHLPAQSDKEPLQGVRRGEHLPAPSEKEHVQAVRRGGHLPAQSHKEQVQDVPSRQGRLDAAGSRGALALTLTDSIRGVTHLENHSKRAPSRAGSTATCKTTPLPSERARAGGAFASWCCRRACGLQHGRVLWIILQIFGATDAGAEVVARGREGQDGGLRSFSLLSKCGCLC